MPRYKVQVTQRYEQPGFVYVEADDEEQAIEYANGAPVDEDDGPMELVEVEAIDAEECDEDE
jgi:hypothetical protein